MTIDLFALIAGAVLSLAFSYIPGLRAWWAIQAAEVKRVIMAGLLFMVAAILFALSCVNWLPLLWPGLTVPCTQAGVADLVRIFILALIANQSTFTISPKLDK